MTIERHLSIKDIMAALGVGRSRAYAIAHEMPHVKAGSSVRVSEAELNRWIKQHTVQPLAREPLMSRSAAAAWARRVRKQSKLRAAAVRSGLPMFDGSTIRIRELRGPHAADGAKGAAAARASLPGGGASTIRLTRQPT